MMASLTRLCKAAFDTQRAANNQGGVSKSTYKNVQTRIYRAANKLASQRMRHNWDKVRIPGNKVVLALDCAWFNRGFHSNGEVLGASLHGTYHHRLRSRDCVRRHSYYFSINQEMESGSLIAALQVHGSPSSTAKTTVSCG